MVLKKQSDILFALIKKMPSNEITQFKRFVKFEQHKPQAYLKMLDCILKITDTWEINEAFPEEKLKKKCGSEITKKYTHYKHLLKKNAFNFNKYLLISEKKNENFKDLDYFKKELAVCSSIYSRFGFYEKLYSRLKELAAEAYDADFYSFSIHIYESMYHYVGMVFPTTEAALKEQKEIRNKITHIEKLSKEFSKTNFYKSYFFLANSLPATHKNLISEDLENFKKFEPKLYTDTIKIDYLLTEVHLSVFNNDYNKNLQANLNLIEFLDKNDNISTKLIRHRFTARFNAFHTALHINNNTLANKLLEEANDFLQSTDKLTESFKKYFYGFYLNGKITFNNYVEGNLENLSKDIDKMEEAIKNQDTVISPDHMFFLKGDYAFSYYLSKNYTLCYDTVESISTKKSLPSLVLVCYILSQYHLFQFDFLENAYRAIQRNLLSKESYSDEEISTIRKIQSRLIKLSATKDKKYVQEIYQLILKIKNPFYLKINSRIAETFKENALQ